MFKYLKRGSTLSELCLELENVFWFCGTERDGSVFVTVGQTTLQTNTFCTAYYLVYVCLKSMYYIRIGKSGILKGIPFNLRCKPQRYIPCHSIGYRYYIYVWQCKECYTKFMLSVMLAMRENRSL